MSNIEQFVQLANDRLAFYPRCSHEQACVYATEDIVEDELGSRIFASKDLEPWLQQVCTREDIDTPHIIVARVTKTSVASALTDVNAICIRGKNTSVATVLHEVAHIVVSVDSHGVLFRDELVRLCRAHISVEYAAMLHSVYSGLGLTMSPWPASAAQR